MGASCSAAVQSRPRRREIGVGQLLRRRDGIAPLRSR